ncbi:Fic family protein [Spirochaeta isovalerica]|uniref:Fido domain-containing protein n=1 Tax=Spirochaeta isovalerica TaxID=150 RepID=A0A841RHT1_9SPIO|nr:Fic family protein [Spirochaeta isovalerica]MBB6481862.1 hypothetical protein [Spirochaeta isovalerica]
MDYNEISQENTLFWIFRTFRRLWFLYEWLSSKKLNLPDLETGNFVPVINPELQFALPGKKVHRQRVLDNMPGTPGFCPLVRRTPLLEEYTGKNLKARAMAVIDRIPSDIISRTASFLLLKDSRASYAIENEVPPHKRIERWGQIIGQAGTNDLCIEELIRLQEILIGDSRFIKTGLRREGGFVGEHDRETGTPIPEHISASHRDLSDLLKGLTSYALRTRGNMDPVIAAAVLAFGFIYIHPFSDGNGRIHRYLIHHILAENGFNPPGLVFPVSAVILDRIQEYRKTLLGYSSRLLPLIQWEPTKDNNVVIKNETAAYYRFFDATPHAGFLYSCVERTIELDLPEEARFLQRYDSFKRSIEEIVEMPSRTVDLLFRFLKQNNGTLSKRAREKEFRKLTDGEQAAIEEIFKRIFE